MAGYESRGMESQLVFHLTLLLARTVEAAASIVSKALLNTSGIPVLLIHLYTNLCCCLSLLLVAFLIEGNKLPRRNTKVQLSVLVIGSLNFFGQLALFYALNFTSPQLVTVISCTIPAVASFVAIVFRMEHAPLNRYDGQVKVLSIVIACCGAFVMAMYQGSKLLGTGISQWQLGSLLAILCSLCAGVGVNVQIPVLRAYQTPWSLMAAVSLTNTTLSMLTCSVLVKHWVLPSPLALLGLVYSGVVGVGVSFGLSAWVLCKAGPLLVYSYMAVTPILATLLSIVFLGSSLYLGSVFGTLIVICGVILCGWSESEGKKMAAQTGFHEPLVV